MIEQNLPRIANFFQILLIYWTKVIILDSKLNTASWQSKQNNEIWFSWELLPIIYVDRPVQIKIFTQKMGSTKCLPEGIFVLRCYLTFLDKNKCNIIMLLGEIKQYKSTITIFKSDFEAFCTGSVQISLGMPIFYLFTLDLYKNVQFK